MKKFIALLLTASVVLGNFCIAFADIQSETGREIMPRYVTSGLASARVSLSGSKASYAVTLRPTTTISYIKATLKLANSSGTVVKTTTKTLYLTNGTFKLATTKALTARGGYHAVYTLNIYKSGKLVETIKGKSAAVKY